MPTPDIAARYDLKDLAARAGVTARTVHFYIQQGLLPPAGQPGPGARYSDAHLARLQLIRRLQREHLPLAEIRQRLGALTDEAVVQLAANSSKSDRKRAPRDTSALDYIRGVLGEAPRSNRRGESRMLADALPVRAQPLPSGSSLEARLEERFEPRSSAPVVPERSQWDRLVLSPDIELHIRRPLTRDQNKRVERLLESARQILKEEDL